VSKPLIVFLNFFETIGIYGIMNRCERTSSSLLLLLFRVCFLEWCFNLLFMASKIKFKE